MEVYTVKIPCHQSWRTRRALRGGRKKDFEHSLLFLMKKNEAYGSGYEKRKGDLLVFFRGQVDQLAFAEDVRGLAEINGFPFELYISETPAILERRKGKGESEDGGDGT